MKYMKKRSAAERFLRFSPVHIHEAIQNSTVRCDIVRSLGTQIAVVEAGSSTSHSKVRHGTTAVPSIAQFSSQGPLTSSPDLYNLSAGVSQEASPPIYLPQFGPRQATRQHPARRSSRNIKLTPNVQNCH